MIKSQIWSFDGATREFHRDQPFLIILDTSFSTHVSYSLRSICLLKSFHTFCVVIFLCIGPAIHAQNLVPNPGFEEIFDCDEFVDCYNNQLPPCPPWFCYLDVNFFNACSTNPLYGVPYNFQGFQYAHSGDGYGGGYQRTSSSLPEWLQIQLTQPLEGGQCYTASMYVNLSNDDCGIANLGMLFTTYQPNYPIGEDPQVEGNGQFFSDTVNWMLITGTFIALGGEEYLTLGNFYPAGETPYDPICVPSSISHAYYYFDDILVEESPTTEIIVDLGGPYEACHIVFLEANVQQDVSYLWSDGSTSENLIVTTSGTYSVTVYDQATCSAGIGSADVVILGSPAVDLGPDTILCLSETLTISLDESLGNYIWDDGSTDGEITISDPGTYYVTFNDGCDITLDHIVVTYLPAPQFSLGADTILCSDETYWLQMDPYLGDFLWNNNSSGSSYFIDQPGLYALTISNHCGEYADDIEITYDEPPTFNLGPDSTVVCIGNNINLQFDPTLGEFVWQDGNTNAEYTIINTGLYSLTVSNACGTHSDHMYVEQISVPVVVLGGSIELCPGETEVIDPGSNYGDYVWQDGSTQPIYEASTSGIYSVTVTNACGMDDASVVVVTAPSLIPPNLGPDISLCPSEPLILAVQGQGANVLWNDLSSADSLVVTTSGIYHVQVSTFCESYSDTIVITVQNNPPSVTLPFDFALCQGQSVTLDAGISNVSYLWNDGSQLSQLLVSSPGVYSLTVLNACGTDVDSVTIIDGGLAPLVSLGSDTAICPGSSITLFPSYANVDTWNWPDGSDTTFFIATAAGQVIVEVSNVCGTAMDSILVGLLPAVPSLDLGADTMICPGETVMLSILIPSVNILWPDNSTGQEYSVSDSTTVIASISNSCGISVDSLDVDLLPSLPLLNLGPDQTICPGATLTISPGINNVQYLWQNGSTGNVFQTTQPDTIVLMISDICGSAIDTMVITESTTGPQLDLGPDIHACEGTIVTIPSGILGVNYQWQDGSMSDVYTTSVSGTYHLTVGNLCGTDQDTIIVDLSGVPPSVSLGQDTVLCVGSTLTLTSHADTSTTVFWQDGSSNLTFDVITSGIYHLTGSNMCGTDSDTIDIQINGFAPVASLGPDTTLCEGETFVLTAIADGFTSALWQDDSTTPTFEVVSSGLYHLTQNNACGIDRDSIVVLMEGLPPSPDLGADTTLCDGATLSLTSMNEPGGISQWQDGSTGLSFLVDAAGIYSIHQSNQCGEGVDTIVVTYQFSPSTFDLGVDTTLCTGGTLLLTAPSTMDQFEWQDGSMASTYLVEQSGIYSLIIQNVCGASTDDIQITYDEHLIHFSFEDEVSICPGDIIELDASQSFAASYLWSTASSLPSISITTPGNYAVTVRTDCEVASHSITVIQDENCDANGGIYIPNVFSPNGDNINDLFNIQHSSDIEITSISGTIYDRWGGLIYHAETNPFTWDGRVSGEDALPGVYVYQLKIVYLNNGREFSELIIGDVTVLR